MNRVCFALLVACWSLWPWPRANADRPNILLIITDDQGYGDFSLHGNPYLQTPNIDRLGQVGVRFDRFYVNSFCAPTRAALLTGRWPLRTGCHGVTHNREAMRPSEVTLAETLREAGYRTACIGKWHNGEQYPYTPLGQGFQEALGFHNGHCNDYFDATLLRGSQPEKTTGYISDVLTDEAIRFMTRPGTDPFFCYLAYNAPHSPFQVADRYFEKFRAKGLEESVAAFYGMCENIDDNVGRLLEALSAAKLIDETLVVFLTDNGGTAGVKLYNAGMRGGKTSMHEGGTRVPLFMHWPGAGWRPHVVKPITAHVDLYPTILDLCSLKPTEPGRLDGLSLRPLLEAEAPGWPERTLFTHNPIDESNRYPGAVRTQRYRLVREIPGRSGGSGAKSDDNGARPWQLYDMEADPEQKENIAASHPAIVEDLSGKYEAWFDDISQGGLQRFPLPIGYPQQMPVELHAPQAFYDKPLQFACGPGFAHDWLTHWTDPRAKVWFELEVVAAGEYELEMSYACPNADAGSTIEVLVGDQRCEAVVPAAPPVDIRLPHRDADGHAKYRNRDWAKLKLGMVALPAGPARLTIQAKSLIGEQLIDFKQLTLSRSDVPR